MLDVEKIGMHRQLVLSARGARGSFAETDSRSLGARLNGC